MKRKGLKFVLGSILTLSSFNVGSDFYTQQERDFARKTQIAMNNLFNKIIKFKEFPNFNFDSCLSPILRENAFYEIPCVNPEKTSKEINSTLVLDANKSFGIVYDIRTKDVTFINCDDITNYWHMSTKNPVTRIYSNESLIYPLTKFTYSHDGVRYGRIPVGLANIILISEESLLIQGFCGNDGVEI